MNRRLFLKRSGLLVAIGLIQPVELIKLFKPRTKTFYSLPPAGVFTIEDFNSLLKKTYGDSIVSLFKGLTLSYEDFREDVI